MIVVEPLPEGVWLATSPDVPGLIVEMSTRDEAIEAAQELAFELRRLEVERGMTVSGGLTLPACEAT